MKLIQRNIIDYGQEKELIIMTAIALTMEHEEKTNLFEHLRQQRMDAAKVFPHCGEEGADYITRIHGCKLSEASVKALKRG